MRKKTPFAIGTDNRLTIRVDAIMPIMVAMIDGLSLCYYGAEDVPYLAIEDAISWAGKEVEATSHKEYKAKLETVLHCLEAAKRKFESGKIVEANAATD